MQVHRFGEQHRYKQVTVQPLNNQIHREAAPELGTQPKLEQRHANHRNGHHKRANVGDQNRKSDQHGQQQRVVQAENQEANPGGDPYHNHLQHLAANVVGDLLVHLFPDLPRQPAVARQNTAYGVEHLVFIFHQEEDHQRHQHEVDRQRQQSDQGRQRVLHHRIAHRHDAGAHVFGHRVDNPGIHQRRITARQRGGEIRKLIQHAGHIADQVNSLLPGNRHHHKGHQQQDADKQHQHDAGRPAAGTPNILQARRWPLQQVRQHNRYQQRGEQTAEEEQDTEPGDQNNQQSNGFRVAEPTPVPLH